MSSSSSSNTKKSEEFSESAPLLGAPPPQDKFPPQSMSPEQAAAMMAQQYGAYGAAVGYYQDPAAAAAAAAAFAQGAPPPQYYYQGYPPQPQGYPPMTAGGQPAYYQPYAYPPPYSPSGQGPPALGPPALGPTPLGPSAQRPPRSQRRQAGKLSPSNTNANANTITNTSTSTSTNTARKTYPDGQQPIALPLNDEDNPSGSSIPPLQDIFSDSQPINNGRSVGGYGATSSTTSANSPKIYNAPPRASNKSSNSNKVAPSLVRTNSAGDLNKHPLKSNRSASHRRINSAGPLRGFHQRINSGDELPPTDGRHRRGLSGSSAARARSYSAGQMVKKPTHRRGDSTSSMASNVSMSSVVSNIAKSEFFGGVDASGRVQMHFPFEAVRLVMIDSKQPTLRRGHLYFDGHQSDYDRFEEYHLLTSTQDGGMAPAPNWESFDRPSNVCGCSCNNCNGCDGKKQLLPQPNYMLAVSDDVYQRVMGEIADAHTMPCGLFFCGHHEDVAYPSIMIAVVVVTLFFASLVYLAIYTGDLTL